MTGKIKQWLMNVEELAAEAIQNNLPEEEAIQYILDNLDSIKQIRIKPNTVTWSILLSIYREVKERIDK
jgi:hypothetical protein